MKNTIRTCLFIIIITYTHAIYAQDSTAFAKEKDNSKPTNVYSQIDNYFEYKDAKDYNTIGYNGKLSYAANEDNLLMVEIPIKYNSQTEKFGLSDTRLRYFYIPYRDYTKVLGAFGTSLDIYMPTGNYEHGLGSSSWRFAPGITCGIMANKKGTISFFPLLGYLYTTKPTSNLVPESLREEDHGFTFQVQSSIVLSDDIFMFITPIYDVKDILDEREDEFTLEVEPVFDIYKDKFQCGLFYRGEFESNTHALSLYFTVFL